jgi:hypothetical protein
MKVGQGPNVGCSAKEKKRGQRTLIHLDGAETLSQICLV